uniref:HIRAN domain-containing protein n=1 Tax=viral metagenome TaxID=1070528 RepID=A0A6C0APU0_9ZZZZ
MTDWVRVHGFHYNTYVQNFPVTSFLLAGVSNYKETIESIKIDDILEMEYEPLNLYDKNAIVIKRNSEICGYVPKDTMEKIVSFVPCRVKVIDKRLIKNGIYSLRVDIIL